MSIVKKRSSSHEDSIREFRIDGRGFTLGDPLTNFQGVLGGLPALVGKGPDLLKAEDA
jgi:circadian clock protein KaiC